MENDCQHKMGMISSWMVEIVAKIAAMKRKELVSKQVEVVELGHMNHPLYQSREVWLLLIHQESILHCLDDV